MISKISTYQPTFTRNSDNINPQLQKLIDSVDTSLIKTQKLRDSFEQIGHNNKPVVAVVDDINSIDIDVNGDEINDLSHCETVSLFAADNANILPVGIDMKESSLEVISRLIRAIDSGANVDAINMSIGLSIDREQFYNIFKDVAPHQMREAILQKSQECYNNLEENQKLLKNAKNIDESSKLESDIALGYLYPAFKVLRTLPEIDIPVYIAEDNNPRRINLVGYFFKNPVIVSGTQKTGRQEHSTFYVTEQYLDKELKGYDINNDNVIDVLANEVSTGYPRVKKYVGKKPESFLPKETFYDALVTVIKLGEKIPEMLIEYCKDCLFTRDHIQKLSIKPLQINKDLYFMSKIDSEKNPFSINLSKVLRKDPRGLLYFGPKEMNVKNAVNMIYGNSFATPASIDKDIAAGKISIQA